MTQSAVATRQDIIAQAARAVGGNGGQATTIEQSRAVAEVQGALIIAQQRPRDEARALERAMESCRTMEVAESAFYKFNRGGENISDATVHLARELARCWGNINYAIVELSRDEARGESEMLAYAWDLETNSLSRTVFIVPHVRDTKSGRKALTDARDIYENNANMGARRLRECIFNVLPPFLKERAKRVAFETLQRGEGDEPFAVQVAAAIEAFERNLKIARTRIEAKLGPIGKMTPIDLANLRVSYGTIVRGEATAEEIFPTVAGDGTADTTAAIRQQAGEQSTGAKKRTKSEQNPPSEPKHDGAHGDSPPPQAAGSEAAASGEGPDDAAILADDIIARINKVELLPDLYRLVGDEEEAIGTLPIAQQSRITDARNAREATLKGGR